MSTKTILITGANRGIGYGLAEQFALGGHHVLAGHREGADTQALAKLAARPMAGSVRLFPLSQTDDPSVNAAARTLTVEHLSLDLLVHNAATFADRGSGSLPEIELDALAEAFSVNVMGPLRVTRALLPALLASRDGAVVAYISSGVASLSQRKMGGLNYAYSISKSALNKAVRTLSHDPAFEGIPQVLFTPGWVKTDMGGDNAELTLAECVEPLAATLLRLDSAHNAQWLDRFGNATEFAW